MSLDKLFSVLNISGSGLAAQRLRMTVISNNVANANTTRAENGKPYRRRVPVFASVLDHVTSANAEGAEGLGGVEVVEVLKSQAPFQRVYMPGHPEANEQGYVLHPNFTTIEEMVDMVGASRAYEANLAVMKTFRELVNRTLSIGQR